MPNERPVFSATSQRSCAGSWYASAPLAPDEVLSAEEVETGVPGGTADVCERCGGSGVTDGLPCGYCPRKDLVGWAVRRRLSDCAPSVTVATGESELSRDI